MLSCMLYFNCEIYFIFYYFPAEMENVRQKHPSVQSTPTATSESHLTSESDVLLAANAAARYTNFIV